MMSWFIALISAMRPSTQLQSTGMLYTLVGNVISQCQYLRINYLDSAFRLPRALHWCISLV